MRHDLKCESCYFQAVWDGLKDFEVRYNDRNFQVGDEIKLIEIRVTRPRFIIKRIKYILHGGLYGLAANYVILGLSD